MDMEKPTQQIQQIQPLIEGHFIHNNLITRLSLYHDRFYYSNQKIISPVYHVNFDFTYDIVKDGDGWLLNIMTPNLFTFYSYVSLEYWEDVLRKVMRRTRFHEFYTGVKVIGRGNFATVYQCKRVKDGKPFAVKAFRKQGIFKAVNGKQALQNEINLLRKLKHPNIAYLQGVYQTQNSIYLVMEMIQGKSLGQFLDKQEIIPLPARKKIIRGILSGLAEMAAQNIVHRDIKPENIIIDSYGQAKIVDFGLATSTLVNKYLYIRCGTPGYVAPEILAIRDTDKVKMITVSDVFSAGAIFYEMIFGKPLFQGEKTSQILQKNKCCFFKISDSPDLISPEEYNLLIKMLIVYPHLRITAAQSLCSSYFFQKRQALKQIIVSPRCYKNKPVGELPPLKYSSNLTNRSRRNKIQGNNQN